MLIMTPVGSSLRAARRWTTKESSNVLLTIRRRFARFTVDLSVPVIAKAQPKSPVLLSVYLDLFKLWQESISEIEGGLGSLEVKVVTMNDCKLKPCFFVQRKLKLKLTKGPPPSHHPLRFVLFMVHFASLK
jgi:hypothetical protein